MLASVLKYVSPMVGTVVLFVVNKQSVALNPVKSFSQMWSSMDKKVIRTTPVTWNTFQVREYKQKTRLRRRCSDCYFKWLNGRLYVECERSPRHKQHHVSSLEKGYDHLAHGFHDSRKKKK
jgi:hypothetical protein